MWLVTLAVLEIQASNYASAAYYAYNLQVIVTWSCVIGTFKRFFTVHHEDVICFYSYFLKQGVSLCNSLHIICAGNTFMNKNVPHISLTKFNKLSLKISTKV